MAHGMNRIDAVLFDFDGTLMDTNDLIFNSWVHAFREIKGEVPEDEVILRTYGEILLDTMRSFFGGDDEELMRNVEIYREYQRNTFKEQIRLFPGAKEMLRDLKDAGYRLAMVTSRLKETTIQYMDEFGIRDLFEVVLTADDSPIHKPEPEPALLALEKMGVSPEHAVMVGDTWSDMECGIRAGVVPIMVGFSIAYKYNKGPDGQGVPEYIIESLADLKPLLDQSR